VTERRAHGDGNLGQVGGDGEDDEAAEGLAQAEARRQDVGRSGELDARDPDGGGGGDEEGEQDRQR
jgi:hypothetical protein